MKNTRPYRAGKQMGEALNETANILYLLDNRQEYLEGLKVTIDAELIKVKEERKKAT